MIDRLQFRRDVLRPALKQAGLYSPEAEELLIGTAAKESRLGTYVRQVGGPALGVFQMEPFTHRDIWNSFLFYRDDLRAQVEPYISREPTDMIFDMRHAVIMARLKYLRAPGPLPSINDLRGQANYWKQHYNTLEGRGTVEQYMADYRRLID